LAAFCAVLLLLAVLRRPWREYVVPASVLLICFMLYVYALPGNEGVRSGFELAPVDTAAIFTQWMASPWRNAWLDAASGPDPMLDPIKWPHRLLSTSAQFAIADLGFSANAICLVAGALGLAVFAICSASVYRRRAPATRLELVSVGVGAYA